MITEASIGIGLVGKEGNQAVSSSDYALTQFSHLRTMLLYHGGEAYRRNAYVICYMYYKNLMMNMPIMIYSFASAFSGQIVYELPIPAVQISSVAFGGDGLNDLYVTTACEGGFDLARGLDDSGRYLGGEVFCAHVDATGRKEWPADF